MAELIKATESGDRVLILTALRDLLVIKIDDPEVPARDLAALAARLQSVLGELSELTAAGKGSAVDDLGSRRAARRAAAQGL